MIMAVFPPEILQDIVGRTTPSWRWGWRWKDRRKRIPVGSDLIWFLNLRLVNFDDIVIDRFLATIRAGLIGHDLPICRWAAEPPGRWQWEDNCYGLLWGGFEPYGTRGVSNDLLLKTAEVEVNFQDRLGRAPLI
ncbi:hypothetical protein IFM53868_07790 [Aspergillus udagawae]|uniref:Uncharacterized protein n=1 Tax=Aspergillus udagawae TaxID=91492 RepID=A0ABQ1B6Z6_9EURO|nr:hypothetical protein IFM53868_07790 [Aspergillus udagawae]